MTGSKYNKTDHDVAHGIMFHHFYDEQHFIGQGAISVDQFENIIEYYGDNLLPAHKWLDKAINNTLDNNHVCLTFDDALLCQYEVALPVMEKYNLTAFWFVYSSVLDGGVENLEIYRKFRTVYFSSIDEFYHAFFVMLEKSEYHDSIQHLLKNKYSHNDWKNFPFYSENDTKFRFIRDVALGVEKYNQVMDLMMKSYNIDMQEFSSDLWMSVEHIQGLHSDGHVIGLHSHTHPTQISDLSVLEQEAEYKKNYDFLHAALGVRPRTVSHPCNSYNNDTLSILRKFNIEMGFRANMERHLFSEFEFPREDHANVIKRIGG